MENTNLQKKNKNNSDDRGAIVCRAMTVRDKLVVGVSAVITMGNHVAQTHGRSRYTASLVRLMDN